MAVSLVSATPVARLTTVAPRGGANTKMDDWVTKSRILQWTWAGHAARRTDGRWSTAAILWEPHGCKRRVGRPVARWRDDLDVFATEILGLDEKEWFLLAPDRAAWDDYKEDYANHLRRAPQAGGSQ